METILKAVASDTALAVEAAAVLIVAYGAAEAFLKTLAHVARGRSPAGWRKDVFVRFGVWLMLGLLFALAADVVRSIIAPTWKDIGELAAIAAIRTFLNYFLEKDIGEATHESAGPACL